MKELNHEFTEWREPRCGNATHVDTNVNDPKVVHKELSYEIIAAALEVLNTLGCGFIEKPYENAMVVELRLRKLQVEQQKQFVIHYKDVDVGEYFPDLLVDGKVIVDTKVIEAITNENVAQMMNYLTITGLKLGIIINFKHPKLEYRRIVR